MPPATVVTISRQDLEENDASATVITDVKPLASYSWIEAPTPTIAVPGIPPRWSPPQSARKLPQDSGMVYIAQNAARHPQNPLEPLFRALDIADPAFDMRSVDVVTDRNNIRKLLAFVDPSSSGQKRKCEAFAIDVEVVQENTVIFSRTETKTQEFIGPHQFRGFGHEFEKAYTTCDIGDSTGHHRIISYRFGGLRFIVRHEVDGYVLRGDAAAPSTSSSKGTEKDSLSSLLGALSLGSTAMISGTPKATKPTTTPTGSKMAIRQEGHAVPLESTLEIKTRVAHKPLEIRDVAPQLWASQTPNLVRAYHHSRGVFPVPQVEDVTADIRRWEQANQASLKKLAALIKHITNAVKRYGGGGGGSAVIRYDDVADDKLKVIKVDRGRMLPDDLYGKWDCDHETKAIPVTKLGKLSE